MTHGSRITEEGALHKYRTEIPNTVIRGLISQNLSIYEKWLYVYLKSVAGEKGTCYRSTTTMAREAGMSRGQVSAAKKALALKGLIVVGSGTNPRRDVDHIHMKDLWPANMDEYSVHEVNTQEDIKSKYICDEEVSSVHTVNSETDKTLAQCSYSELGVHVVNQRRSLEEEDKERDSLTTFESLPDAESEALPSAPLPATNGVHAAVVEEKPRSKPIKPLADDDWLKGVLLDYDTIPFAALNDDAWWVDVSQPLESVFGKTWLNAEMGKISAYLRENPKKRPASASGWKRFVRSWLHRSYERERRYTHGTTQRPFAKRY